MLESAHPDVMASSVPVLQIETRNPHFHDNKGEEHVQGMRMQALNVLYHSPVTLPAVRQAIVEFMVAQGALEPGQEPPRERVYPPVGTLALDLLYDALDAEAHELPPVRRPARRRRRGPDAGRDRGRHPPR